MLRMTTIILACSLCLCVEAQRAGISGATTFGSSLGSEGIESKLTDVLMEVNEALPVDFCATDTGWEILLEWVGETDAPRDSAAALNQLETGFAAFLKDYLEYWSEEDPRAKVFELSPERLEKYYRARRNACGESPCKVPPCCGNGVQCSGCPKKTDLPKMFEKKGLDAPTPRKIPFRCAR